MLHPRLSLCDLDCLVVVAETGDLERAAERCAASSPTLAAQIRKIEAALGLQVFERSGHSAFVTPRGEAVVAQAVRVLAEAERLFETARMLGEPLSGLVRIGAVATLGPYLFPRVLDDIGDRFPTMQVVTETGMADDLLPALAAGRLDAVLSTMLPVRPGLAVRPLFFEPFVLAHPAGSPGTCPAGGKGLVVLDRGHCLREQSLALAGGAGDGAGMRHVPDLETARSLVATGEGCTIMPRLAADAHGDGEGDVLYTAFDDPRAGRLVAILHREDDARVEALATHLAQNTPAGTLPPDAPLPIRDDSIAA